MASRAPLGLGVLVLSIAPLAVLDCFSSSAGNPGPDASFDSTALVDGFGGETGDDAVTEASAGEAAATDTGNPPVDSGAPEAQVVDAEAGPPVLEVIGQNLYGPIAMAVDPQFIYFLESGCRPTPAPATPAASGAAPSPAAAPAAPPSWCPARFSRAAWRCRARRSSGATPSSTS